MSLFLDLCEHPGLDERPPGQHDPRHPAPLHTRVIILTEDHKSLSGENFNVSSPRRGSLATNHFIKSCFRLWQIIVNIDHKNYSESLDKQRLAFLELLTEPKITNSPMVLYWSVEYFKEVDMLNETVCLNRRRKSRRRTCEASPVDRRSYLLLIDHDSTL